MLSKLSKRLWANAELDNRHSVQHSVSALLITLFAVTSTAHLPFQGGTSFVDLLCFCSVLCLIVLCGHRLGKG